MALDDHIHRSMTVGESNRLRKASPLAVRVFLALFWGEDSERAGFGRCRPGSLADQEQSSRRAVVAALDELQSAGLIVWSQSEALAIRPGFANQFWPNDPSNQINWWRAIIALRDGFVAAQLRESVAHRTPPTSVPRKAPGSLPTSVPGADVSPRVLESESPSVQLPAAQEAVASATPATPAKTTTPEQLQLAVKEPKPKKVKPKSVEDAEMLHEAWNFGASQIDGWTTCSRCDGAVRSLLGRAYKIMVERLPPDDTNPDQPVEDLLQWAVREPYWSGAKYGKPWDIMKFFASNNLDKLIADYRRAQRGGNNEQS